MRKIILLQLLLAALQSTIGEELDYQTILYATKDEPVTLKCTLKPSNTIKVLQWFKESLNGKDRLYYYEPASAADSAFEARAKRSSKDGSSLIIDPVKKSDEGYYICAIDYWRIKDNSTKVGIPEHEEARMRLIVNVPPKKVEVTYLSSGGNLTLRCKAEDAKPAAQIFWLKTLTDGTEEELNKDPQTISERSGGLVNTTGLLYYSLKENEKIARISCVVKHPETNTTVYKSVTFVTPRIQNAVQSILDRFAQPISVSSINNQDSEDNTPGMVKISAHPGFQVFYNTSLSLKATAPGVFPSPQFLWWTGDQTAISGSELNIPHLISNKTYYVLAKNTLGKVVLSVPVSVTYSEVDTSTTSVNGTTGDGPGDQEVVIDDGGLDTGAIISIVIGSLLGVALILFLVWYFLLRNKSASIVESKPRGNTYFTEEEGVPFRPNDKPLMRTTSTQTLEGRRSRHEASMKQAASADNIISQKSPEAHTPPPTYSNKSSKRKPSERKMGDYGESGSLVGEYGSRNAPGSSASSQYNLRSARGDDSDTERSLTSSEEPHISRRSEMV